MLEFKLPEVGENITSGTVVSVFVKPGDRVKKNQDLLELETDKASLPVPSPGDGVIKEVLVKPGDEAQIGQVVLKIEEDAAVPAGQKNDVKEPAPTPAPAQPAAPRPEEPGAGKMPEPAPEVKIPAARENVPASPSVRRLARELGVDISRISGSGPGGRISKEDVKAFVKQTVASASGPGGPVAETSSRPLPDFSRFGEVSREGMSKIRQVTASHLSHCWQTIPHVTQFAKADITELEKLRKRVSTEERKLTITPFLMKVLASALKTFPQFNASVDMPAREIIYKKYFNIGVAVDTPRGLLVPVVRDVDSKSIFELTDELNAMAERTRDKKTGLEELQGGSMTLTNLGGIGGTAFTPIVNWPEVAILGVSRGSYEPVYENGHFIPRLMLPLSLSYDHRVIDGADGARFIRRVCESIEQPFIMELDK
jgi:pyruvate dehydrogenase E2 component (dihydrolipoamide acetyltransferase)